MSEQRRTTIYLDRHLHVALRLKAAETSESMSSLVNRALRLALAEDLDERLRVLGQQRDEVAAVEREVRDLKAYYDLVQDGMTDLKGEAEAINQIRGQLSELSETRKDVAAAVRDVNAKRADLKGSLIMISPPPCRAVAAAGHARCPVAGQPRSCCHRAAPAPRALLLPGSPAVRRGRESVLPPPPECGGVESVVPGPAFRAPRATGLAPPRGAAPARSPATGIPSAQHAAAR